jgi:hypothetical protein
MPDTKPGRGDGGKQDPLAGAIIDRGDRGARDLGEKIRDLGDKGKDLVTQGRDAADKIRNDLADSIRAGQGKIKLEGGVEVTGGKPGERPGEKPMIAR